MGKLVEQICLRENICSVQLAGYGSTIFWVDKQISFAATNSLVIDPGLYRVDYTR